jgi:hypothetical protein
VTATVFNQAAGNTISFDFSEIVPGIRKSLSILKRIPTVLIYGICSISLYYILYQFSGEIRYLAESTNQGDKAFFFLPICIALAFSVVHGLFTDRFWESLGLKAKG